MGRTKGSKNKLKIVGGQLPEAEIIEMAECAKNYRPIKAIYDGEKLPDTTIDEHPMYAKSDPVDLPSNWNEMGKVQKLEWLTANPRK